MAEYYVSHVSHVSYGSHCSHSRSHRLDRSLDERVHKLKSSHLESNLIASHRIVSISSYLVHGLIVMKSTAVGSSTHLG